jgi:hypothetical protein
MMTNRELKELLDSLSEEELDKQVCLYSGSVESLVDFSAKILDDDEFEKLCYEQLNDDISRLVLYEN